MNRSLWADEADLALNIMHRSWAGLMQPLDNHQGAPLGFLAVEKSIVHFFGSSEYALRLAPLLAGMVSVFLFYRVGKDNSAAAVPIAVGLFAVSPSLIYYSSEVKQYSCDVAVALLLYWVAIEGTAAEWKPGRVALLGVVGSAAVWTSHPSTFILAGIGATMVVALVMQKDWIKLTRVSMAFLMWAASLAACYLIALRRLSQDKYLLDYWKDNFMPCPPVRKRWQVVCGHLLRIFQRYGELEFIGLAGFVFIVGSVSMFRRNPERLFLKLTLL